MVPKGKPRSLQSKGNRKAEELEEVTAKKRSVHFD
jgi:hypothetical protein